MSAILYQFRFGRSFHGQLICYRQSQFLFRKSQIDHALNVSLQKLSTCDIRDPRLTSTTPPAFAAPLSDSRLYPSRDTSICAGPMTSAEDPERRARRNRTTTLISTQRPDRIAVVQAAEVAGREHSDVCTHDHNQLF